MLSQHHDGDKSRGGQSLIHHLASSVGPTSRHIIIISNQRRRQYSIIYVQYIYSEGRGLCTTSCRLDDYIQSTTARLRLASCLHTTVNHSILHLAHCSPQSFICSSSSSSRFLCSAVSSHLAADITQLYYMCIDMYLMTCSA